MYLKTSFSILLTYICVVLVYSKPVIPENKNVTPEPPQSRAEVSMENLEFGRYLQQVVQALEGDPELSKRLQDVSQEDLNSGKFAKYLDSAHLDTRTKLNEVKRMEAERVRKAMHNQKEDTKPSSKHLDIRKSNFDVHDLQKLIIAAKHHYDEIENMQEEEYKQYEMEKKLRHKIELDHMKESEKKKAMEKDEKIKQLIEEEGKHIKHPGSKHQLEDVWKERNLDPRDMDPDTLFQMLDMDGNDILDIYEVRMLFLPEVHELKHWNETEKQHELNRLVHHFMGQYDSNKNGLIEKNEWDGMTHDPEYERDDGWDTDYDPNTDDEFDIFRKEHESEFDDEYVKEHPGSQPLPPHVGNEFPEHGNQIKTQQQNQNQNQVPPAQQNQVPQHGQQNQISQQGQQNQIPHQGQQNQIPQQGQQNQIPHQGQQNPIPQQGQQNQIPQQGQQNQIPQQGQQNQIPQQGQRNQIPQQGQMNQIPQQVQQNKIPQYQRPT